MADFRGVSYVTNGIFLHPPPDTVVYIFGGEIIGDITEEEELIGTITEIQEIEGSIYDG